MLVGLSVQAYKERYASSCWSNTTQPQLPVEVANPWVATANAFNIRLATSLVHRPLIEALRRGLVPQVHPWFGVLYDLSSEQAVNYPIPAVLGPPPDGPPRDALEVSVQQGNLQAEVSSDSDGAPVPPNYPLHFFRSWLQEGRRGVRSPFHTASLTKAAREAFSLWHGIVTLLGRLTRVLLCTVGGRGEGSILIYAL